MTPGFLLLKISEFLWSQLSLKRATLLHRRSVSGRDTFTSVHDGVLLTAGDWKLLYVKLKAPYVVTDDTLI